MASVILIIRYRPSEAQVALPSEQWRQRAGQIAEINGLAWKYWLRDPQTGMHGGVYLFDDRTNAEKADGLLVRSLEQAGAGDVSSELFEIDGDLSAITHAKV